MLKEFKEFISKGNVIDLAVGIIIGAAFGKIVSSFVADLLMPPIGLLLGGMDFSAMGITLKDATPTSPAVVIAYGKFIQTVVDFLIISGSIFVVIKAINKFRSKKDEQPAPTKDQELLTEIRDLLREEPAK